MHLHPRYDRTLEKRRFQPIDLNEPMPDVEKLKINVGTFITALGAVLTAAFLAGGWFFGMRSIESKLKSIEDMLHTTVEHNIKLEERLAGYEHRLKVIENWDSVKSSRGLNQ